MTADPQFRKTPRSRRATEDVKYLKSRRLASPMRRAGGERMHVDDVGADRHVDGHWNAEPMGGRGDADLRERRGVLGQEPAH